MLMDVRVGRFLSSSLHFTCVTSGLQSKMDALDRGSLPWKGLIVVISIYYFPEINIMNIGIIFL